MIKRSFLFVVQGEGRGHMTQAMALYDLLTGQGHEVVCVAVGSTNLCEVPEFFRKKFDCPVVALPSPRFSKDQAGKAIRLGRTVWHTMKSLPNYLHGVKVLHRLVNYHAPDVILNFYDPLVGIYAMTTRSHPRIVSIAHQYVYLHPEFRFPDGRDMERRMIRNYTALTAAGSTLRLAISLYDMPEIEEPRLKVIPPILRNEALHHPVHEGDHLLVYVVNPGYVQDILDWHEKFPDVKVHAFTDASYVREQHGGRWEVDDTLTIHSLNGPLFLKHLSSCKALACTAVSFPKGKARSIVVLMRFANS